MLFPSSLLFERITAVLISAGKKPSWLNRMNVSDSALKLNAHPESKKITTKLKVNNTFKKFNFFPIVRI